MIYKRFLFYSYTEDLSHRSFLKRTMRVKTLDPRLWPNYIIHFTLRPFDNDRTAACAWKYKNGKLFL